MAHIKIKYASNKYIKIYYIYDNYSKEDFKMSLGNENKYDNNRRGNNEYSPSVYSPYTLKNPNGVDPSALSFQYYRKMLKISISPAIEMKEGDDYQQYDSENAVKVYLTPQKAMIFLEDVKEFLADPDAFNNSGVPSGSGETSGLISISNGKELGVNKPQLIIRRLDIEGNIVSSAAYQFNDPDYNTSLRNFDEETKQYSVIPRNNMEIKVLIAHLEEFIKASTFALAYTFVEADKKNAERVYSIYESTVGGNKGSSKGKSNTGTSFFNNKNSNSIGNSAPQRNQSSLNQLADEIEGE